MGSRLSFFDILPGDEGGCVALSPWKSEFTHLICIQRYVTDDIVRSKARIALNYKAVPYETVWSEYVELPKTLGARGILPNASSGPWNPEYYSPALVLPDGRTVMGTLDCVTVLEELWPEPSLRLDNGYVEKADQATMAVMMGSIGDAFPAYATNCLTLRDRESFQQTRSAWLGVASFAELAANPNNTGESGWRASELGLQACVELLLENEEGPFIEGNNFSYADCILGSVWMTYKRIGERFFKRIMAYDERLQKHYDACLPYLPRTHE